VLTTDDLVAGDNAFFSATGITDGELLRGVRFSGPGATTQSLLMRSSTGTVRFVSATHRRAKLAQFDLLGPD
jgi:fructose-1,6-bisphosphatase II